MSPETLQTVEDQKAPEYEPLDLVNTIVISGPSNSGKRRLMEILHERYDWPVYDGTEDGFTRRGESQDQGYIEREIAAHGSFDAQQGLIFRNLTAKDDKRLHETRLGGIILAEEKDRRSTKIAEINKRNLWLAQQGKPLIPVPEEIPAKSILLWARKEIRVDRAYNQIMKAWQDQQEQLDAGASILPEDMLPKPTRISIETKMEERERKDVEDWAPLHKYVEPGKNPFSRSLANENGGPVYDRFIDTSDLTIEEVADKFVEVAFLAGAVRWRLISENQSGSIFESTTDNLEGGRNPNASLPPSY